MKKLILVLFFISTPLYANDWTTFNTVNEIAFLTLTFIDMKQTLYFCKQNDIYYKQLNRHDRYMERYSPYGEETNPFLGPRPSQKRIKCMIGGAMVLHPIISYLLPKDIRNYWQGATVAIELKAVYTNYKHGVSFSSAMQF